MADQQKQQEAPKRAGELDDQQLDQVAGGTTRPGSDVAIAAPKESFAQKLGGVAKGVTQVGVPVVGN
jgi:hypothetical protein